DVGDQKGLLTAAHAEDLANVYGERYNGPGDDMSDIAPDVLWHYLKLYVKQQGLPLILDIDAGEQVWYYPVYAYKVSYTPAGGDDYRCVMTIFFSDNAISPEIVGVKANSRTYSFTCKMREG